MSLLFYLIHVAFLLEVLVIFYVLGSILVGTMNYFEKQNEEKLKEEGEVIEKDSDEADQNPEEMNQEEKQ